MDRSDSSASPQRHSSCWWSELSSAPSHPSRRAPHKWPHSEATIPRNHRAAVEERLPRRSHYDYATMAARRNCSYPHPNHQQSDLRHTAGEGGCQTAPLTQRFLGLAAQLAKRREDSHV